MRDVNRFHEKVQLSLDNRQVAGLIAVGLALLVGVFSLGIVVGRQMAAAFVPAPAPLGLAALDARRAEAEAALVKVPQPTSAPTAKSTTPASANTTATPTAKSTATATATAITLTATTSSPIAAPAVTSPPATNKPVAPADVAAKFTVQVASTPKKEDAERIAATLKGRGFAPYVESLDRGAHGLWYRVRVGRYVSREGAATAAKEIGHVSGKPVVMPLAK